jgi:hypothetical protein
MSQQITVIILDGEAKVDFENPEEADEFRRRMAAKGVEVTVKVTEKKKAPRVPIRRKEAERQREKIRKDG